MGVEQDPSSGEPGYDTGEQGVDLTPHPILDLIMNKVKPGEVIVVTGYLGAPDNNVIRIYLDLSLSAYLEVQADKVLYAEKFDPSDETKPTKILVASDAPLKLVRTVEASFVKGLIVSTHPITPPVATGVLGVTPEGFAESSGTTCVKPRNPIEQFFEIRAAVQSNPPLTPAG